MMRMILLILSGLALGQTPAFASRANPSDFVGTFEIVETRCDPPGGPCRQFTAITVDIRLAHHDGLRITIGPWDWDIFSPNCDSSPGMPNVCHEDPFGSGEVTYSFKVSIEKMADGLYKAETDTREFVRREGLTAVAFETIILRKVR